MRNAQVQTKRVFDTPAGLVIALVSFTIISIVACFNVDSLTIFPSEKYGYYLATVMAIGLSAHATHIWLWGRKVTYGPVDLYRTHR